MIRKKQTPYQAGKSTQTPYQDGKTKQITPHYDGSKKKKKQHWIKKHGEENSNKPKKYMKITYLNKK
jgi:hypothetical protein